MKVTVRVVDPHPAKPTVRFTENGRSTPLHTQWYFFVPRKTWAELGYPAILELDVDIP